MRIHLPILCLASVAVLASCTAVAPAVQAPGPSSPSIDPILLQAEGLFRNMQARDYPAIWALLSSKSREAIVRDVLKESGGAGEGKEEAGEVARDFARGGTIARAYWDGYLQEFDPEAALSDSRWEMGKVEEDSAEVLITHKRSERPAVLRMFREDGLWKVGLVETFRLRPPQ